MTLCVIESDLEINVKLSKQYGEQEGMIKMITVYDLGILQSYLLSDLINIIITYAVDNIFIEYEVDITSSEIELQYRRSNMFMLSISINNYEVCGWINIGHEYGINMNSEIIINAFNITKTKSGYNVCYIPTIQLVNEYMRCTYGLQNYITKNIDNTYSFIDDICIYKNKNKVIVSILQNTHEIALTARVLRKLIDMFNSHN